MSVYAWIREGVKRSVLLGFSDALEQLGVPEGDEQRSEQMLALLRGTAPVAIASTSSAASGKRRLGRSLDQIAGDENPRRAT